MSTVLAIRTVRRCIDWYNVHKTAHNYLCIIILSLCFPALDEPSVTTVYAENNETRITQTTLIHIFHMPNTLVLNTTLSQAPRTYLKRFNVYLTMLIPLHSSYLKKEQVYPHIINMYEEKSSKTFYTLFISLIHSYILWK